MVAVVHVVVAVVGGGASIANTLGCVFVGVLCEHVGLAFEVARVKSFHIFCVRLRLGTSRCLRSAAMLTRAALLMHEWAYPLMRRVMLWWSLAAGSRRQQQLSIEQRLDDEASSAED